MTPLKCRKMYTSFSCSLPASWKQTLIFLCPLAARGMNSDGKRLSLSCGRMCSPAADMSAPESGSTWVR